MRLKRRIYNEAKKENIQCDLHEEGNQGYYDPIAEMAEPLSAIEVTYKEIKEITVETKSEISKPEEIDLYSTSIWAINLLTETNLLDSMFPSNEAIMEVMNLIEKPWETNHHKTYFLHS